MKQNRKTVTVFLTAAALAVAVPASAWASEGSQTAVLGGQTAGYWQQTAGETGSIWMYVDSRGEYVRDCRKEIDGRIYFFDEAGKMLSGWISQEGTELDDSGGQGYLEGVYYCGGPEEGAAATGWKYLPVKHVNGGMEHRWFYFKSGGKKVVSTSITESDENGQYRYTFDEYGILRSSKKTGGKDGVLKEQWIQRVPKRSQDPYASENGILRWYYGLSDGNVVRDRIKTIDGKEYLFDSVGIMRTGLVAVTSEKKFAETLICEGDSVDCDVELLENCLDEYDLMYFDEQSGARQTGTVQISSYGDTYTFEFMDSGKAVHGPKNGKLYRAGVLQTADTGDKYQVKTVDDEDYLVNTSGRIQPPGRYRDGDMVWTVERGEDGYEITAGSE